MPPHKHPASLISLLMRGTVELIHTSAVNIDKVPTEHPAYLESINTVQEVLLALAPPIWEVVYDDITAKDYDSKSLDYILIHEYSKKLILKQHVYENVNFHWRPYNQKLKKVHELDLTFLPQELTTTVIRRIETVCDSSKLERITFDSIIPDDFNMLAICRELRSISHRRVTIPEYCLLKSRLQHDIIAAKLVLELFPKLENYNFYEMGKVLTLLDSNRSLNLRKVEAALCSVEQIKKIVSLCPHLQVLHIRHVSADSDYCQILEVLSSSSLQIHELVFKIVNNDICTENFFNNKGIHFRKLNITFLCPISMVVVRAIAESCINLTHFKLEDYSKRVAPNDMQLDVVVFDKHESALTQLQEFSLNSFRFNLPLLRLVLPKISNISFLDISTFHRVGDLIELIDSIKMENLAHFKYNAIATMPESVVRCLYEKCPSLTRIQLLCHLDDSAEIYGEFIQQQVKENNLDFIISWLGQQPTTT